MRPCTALLAGCVILILALGYKVHELSDRVRSEALTVKDELREAHQLQDGLINLVNTTVPAWESISGFDQDCPV